MAIPNHGDAWHGKVIFEGELEMTAECVAFESRYAARICTSARQMARRCNKRSSPENDARQSTARKSQAVDITVSISIGTREVVGAIANWSAARTRPGYDRLRKYDASPVNFSIFERYRPRGMEEYQTLVDWSISTPSTRIWPKPQLPPASSA